MLLCVASLSLTTGRCETSVPARGRGCHRHAASQVGVPCSAVGQPVLHIGMLIGSGLSAPSGRRAVVQDENTSHVEALSDVVDELVGWRSECAVAVQEERVLGGEAEF